MFAKDFKSAKATNVNLPNYLMKTVIFQLKGSDLEIGVESRKSHKSIRQSDSICKLFKPLVDTSPQNTKGNKMLL